MSLLDTFDPDSEEILKPLVRPAGGCIAVEMECASVMAVGQFRGAPVYQFLYAEDSLDGNAWDARTWGAGPASDYEKYLRVALEAAVRL